MSKIKDKSKYLAITILIGGKSTRFGSDKGLFQISGKPLISYQLETLAKLNYDIFLVAHSKQQIQKYINKIDIKNIMAFIIDEQYIDISKIEEQTPIIGLYSAFKELSKLGYKKSLVLPCDTPLVQKNVIEFLILNCKNYDCCIPQWENGFLEPLLAIYPIKKALHSTEKNIKRQNLKLVNIIDKTWKINYLSIENEIRPLDNKFLTFININKISDIDKIKKK